MPELPEVETVRRMLETDVIGRTIRVARLSGARLRGRPQGDLPRRLAGRRLLAARRHGKYLLLDLDGGLTLLSHLGMSGRWLFHPRPPAEDAPHVHARLQFADGSQLWFQDPRRFGLLRVALTARLGAEPSLARLGPDPVNEPPTGAGLRALAEGRRVSIKGFLMDQRRLAGIGNIYASEILHRAGVDPRTRAGAIAADRWTAIAREIRSVLGEAIARFGTTFSMYRTLWNEPGAYGEQLRVYDRSGEPCQGCGTAIQRVVQGGRSTFFCPCCQSADRPPRAGASRKTGPAGHPRHTNRAARKSRARYSGNP